MYHVVSHSFLFLRLWGAQSNYLQIFGLMGQEGKHTSLQLVLFQVLGV